MLTLKMMLFVAHSFSLPGGARRNRCSWRKSTFDAWTERRV